MRLIGITLTIFILLHNTRAKAQATDTTQGQVLVLEEFNDNSRQWSIINHGDTAFTKVADGHYILNNKKANQYWALRLSPWGSSVPTLALTQPMQFEMKVMLSSDDESAYCGMIWNTVKNPSDIFDEYRFLISKDGYFAIVQRLDGHNVVIVRGTRCPYINDRYNVLRVSQTADSLHRFYINDQLVYQKKLTLANPYPIGFYLDAHAVMYVDRVKMSKAR